MNDKICKAFGYTQGDWFCYKLDEIYLVDNQKKTRIKVEDKTLETMYISARQLDDNENEKELHMVSSVIHYNGYNNFDNDSKVMSFSKKMLEHLIMLNMLIEEKCFMQDVLGTARLLKTITGKSWGEIKDIYLYLDN